MSRNCLLFFGHICAFYLCVKTMMKNRVRKPRMPQCLACSHPPADEKHRSFSHFSSLLDNNISSVRTHRDRKPLPFIYNEESPDEVFGFLRCVNKLLFLKAPLAGQDVVQSLIVVIAKERTQTTQTNMKEERIISISCEIVCMCL